MNRLLAAGIAVAAAFFAFDANAQPNQPAPPAQPTRSMPAINVNVSSQDFVAKAAISDRYEIRAAKIALERSRNPDIDRFANRMIHDHSQSTKMLKDTVAQTGKLYLPDRLDAEYRGMIGELRRVSPRQFAQTYMQQQVEAHESAVALFTAYKHQGDNLRLRHFAMTVLPVIRHHLDMARGLAAGSRIARGGY